jgi:hypothetical protein
MITEYELYSDERTDRMVGTEYLTIGGVICTAKGRDRLLARLTAVREHHGLTGEAGWKKVSTYYLSAYKEWLDVFFDDPHARYSMLSINRSTPEWQTFRAKLPRSSTHDDTLASIYYQFLLTSFGGLHDTKRWSVYPDAGYFSHDKVLAGVEFLFNRTYKKALGPKSTRILRGAKALDSKKSDLVQLADLLLGCGACDRYARAPESEPRRSLVAHFRARCHEVPRTKKGLLKLSAQSWVSPEHFFRTLQANPETAI